DARHDALDVLGPGEIAEQRQGRRVVRGGDRRGGRAQGRALAVFGRPGLAPAMDADRAAEPREGLRERTPQPAPGAGDERDLAVESARCGHAPIVPWLAHESDSARREAVLRGDPWVVLRNE